MVPWCYMFLCPRDCGLEQYGRLNSSRHSASGFNLSKLLWKLGKIDVATILIRVAG